MYIDQHDIVGTIKDICSHNHEDFYKPWTITYHDSPGIGRGLSRDLSIRFIKECCEKKYLVCNDNNTYTFNSELDKKQLVTMVAIAQYIIKTVFVDQISLSITLDPLIILVLANICNPKGKLLVKYSLLKHMLSDQLCKLIDCKKYDLMIDYVQSKTMNDVIMINNTYYSLKHCCEINELKNKKMYLITKQDCIDYVDIKFKFDVWYSLQHIIHIVCNMNDFFREIIPDEKQSLLTANVIFEMLHGVPITIDTIVDNLIVKECANKLYTTNGNNCTTSSLGGSYTIHSDNKNIRIYTIDHKSQDLKSNIIDAIQFLKNEYDDFEKKLIEFWYGTSVMSANDTSKPTIVIKDLDYKLLNKTPVSSATCFFTLYVPSYSIDVGILDVDELKTFFKDKYNSQPAMKLLLIKRLYDSVITGYDILQKSNLLFNVS
jgi:hypothetical protein